MIEKFAIELPNKISLSCRAAGPEYAPVLLFLHGFPEAAFVWDDMLRHFSRHYRCIAPNLRGYERSSRPEEVQAYRAHHLVADVAALVDQLDGRLEALIAHDWGGAIAWNFAARHPMKLRRMVIVNSPHPAILLRELKNNPAQQAASAYMNFLCRPDAEQLLEADDFELAWNYLQGPGDVDDTRPGANWLTEAMKERYRELWSLGMQGAINYYRASPLRPATETDMAILQVNLPDTAVNVPTRVVWAEGDSALLPGLVEGLDAYVPDLTLVRIPQASHWVIHEQPTRIAHEIEAALAVDVAVTV